MCFLWQVCAHLVRTRAVEQVPADEALLLVMEAVTRCCLASKPLTVELFCDGVLGALMRAAQRLLAAVPREHREDIGLRILHESRGHADWRGVSRMLDAFGHAVPQARVANPKTLNAVLH